MGHTCPKTCPKAAATDEITVKTGAQFIDFTFHFFNTAKTLYRHENQVRANSLAFQAILELSQRPAGSPPVTMSGLADLLRIPKQQLTKLVNDLEEKKLVTRIHDQANRRKVYISITPSGQELLSTLHQAMLDSTIQALSVYTRDELSEMSPAFETISRLMQKFNPDILLMPLTMK